jgi:hypothetical protein
MGPCVSHAEISDCLLLLRILSPHHHCSQVSGLSGLRTDIGIGLSSAVLFGFLLDNILLYALPILLGIESPLQQHTHGERPKAGAERLTHEGHNLVRLYYDCVPTVFRPI